MEWRLSMVHENHKRKQAYSFKRPERSENNKNGQYTTLSMFYVILQYVGLIKGLSAAQGGILPNDRYVTLNFLNIWYTDAYLNHKTWWLNV